MYSGRLRERRQAVYGWRMDFSCTLTAMNSPTPLRMPWETSVRLTTSVERISVWMVQPLLQEMEELQGSQIAWNCGQDQGMNAMGRS